MSRRLTPATTLDNLKKEAKRWLKALRAGDRTARERLDRAHRQAPAEPGLRDVQHALAREHDLPSWAALKEALADLTLDRRGHAERVAWFLENACPDHHVRGGPDHLMARHTAMYILSRHPEVARDGLATAVVCGDLAAVERILAERPEAAREKTADPDADRAGVGGSGDRFRKTLGPKGWEPLLYLCFTRLPLATANDNAVVIARALLDHGADPNAFFMAGSSRYVPLVGVIGEGEEHRTPHPRRDELTRLLLERGAEPYDGQVLYNLHFHGDFLWFLELIHEFSVKAGRRADWDAPNWPMLDMGPYGCGARYLLGFAVRNNDLRLAEWCLAHGASPNPPPAPGTGTWRQPQTTLHEEALRNGHLEMADLLVRHGATPGAAVTDGEPAFVAACFRLDRAQAKALLEGHPEYLLSPTAMFLAARQDRADVVAFLLDLGTSPDVPGPGGQRPLHEAAYHDAVRVATLLIERGAAIDPVDDVHGGTPLWFATWDQRPRTIELLSRHSHDVWALSLNGNVERLRDVLAAEPRLATLTGDGDPPLMYLPGDETRAREVVELFLAYGADPSLTNRDGQTAADIARKRGLDEAAELLRPKAGGS